MEMSNHVDEFPIEIKIEIFSYLNVKSLCNLMLTCKHYADIIRYWRLLDSKINVYNNGYCTFRSCEGKILGKYISLSDYQIVFVDYGPRKLEYYNTYRYYIASDTLFNENISIPLSLRK